MTEADLRRAEIYRDPSAGPSAAHPFCSSSVSSRRPYLKKKPITKRLRMLAFVTKTKNQQQSTCRKCACNVENVLNIEAYTILAGVQWRDLDCSLQLIPQSVLPIRPADSVGAAKSTCDKLRNRASASAAAAAAERAR
jgi:hypothetical protein